MASIKRSSFLTDKSKYREDIEWTNTWISGANENDNKPYVLLIGDSLSREIRSTLEKKSNTHVDYIGVSSLIFDDILLRTIETFFEVCSRKYSLIHIQLGDHGILSSENESDKELFYLMYKEQYGNVLDFLMTKTDNLVVGTSTQVILYPMYTNKFLNKCWTKLHRITNEIVDERYEKYLIRRNEIVEELASIRGLKVNDLYAIMRNKGLKYRHKDHVHYENSSKSFIADTIMTYYG